MKIIVAITGASGAIYGVKLLENLRDALVETHLIISKWGRYTIQNETKYSVEEVKELATVCYDEEDMAAAISSGSYKNDGMIVAPCSMKTLAGITTGFDHDLIIRAANVAIKERRRLVLLTRESPLSTVHLENMLKASRLGVVIMPPVPAFYCKPQSLDDIVSNTIARVLDQFGLELDTPRWGSL
ncbi:MAG: UbiX family flavin prenyltransferase [Dehalobacterium sp.]